MMTLSDSRGIKGQSQRMEFSPHLGRQPEPVVDEEAAGAATARRGSGEAAAEQRDDNDDERPPWKKRGAATSDRSHCFFHGRAFQLSLPTCMTADGVLTRAPRPGFMQQRV
jgi:hypothetical protein